MTIGQTCDVAAANVSAAGALLSRLNVLSCVRNSAGDYTIVTTTDFDADSIVTCVSTFATVDTTTTVDRVSSRTFHIQVVDLLASILAGAITPVDSPLSFKAERIHPQ